MDNGFGPNVDSDAISARIKEEGLVQTWIGIRILVVDGGGFGANVDRDAKLMVFDIPTGLSSGVEMDNRFCPNVDTDAILARIKEEGLVQTWIGMRISVVDGGGFGANVDRDAKLMVFDIPTGSSSGVEMDNRFCPNVDTDAILARIKEEGLVQTWIGMRISLMGFDIPTGSSSGVEVEYILTDKTETLTGKKMIFRSICINGVFYGNETGDALKDMELLNAVSSVSSDVGVLFLFQSQSTNRMKRFVYVNDDESSASQDLYCDNHISNRKYSVLNFIPKNLWEQFRMKRFVYVNDDESSASQDLYCDNHISNRKYSVLNFIPKNLWEQFSRFMNQYFLLIACLQLWSLITPVNPASTWACKYMGSFIFIFAVSASKEAWGDCNRYLSDKKQTRNKSGLLDKVEAQDIHVRNIVWLRENDEVPCDLVLIGTSDPLGLCYIETAALDGETDLKTRSILSTCMGIPFNLLYKIKGVIECPKPDKDIRRFDANLRLFPPFIDNDLMVFDIPTGSSSGVEMDNGFGPNVDSDAISARIKEEGLLMVFDIPTGSSSGVEMDNGFGPNIDSDAISARIKEEGLVQTWIGIQISLMVFDIPTGSSSGVEIEYTLTDKTETLTGKKMIFRRCCINGVFYGNETGDALKDMELLNAVSSGSSDVVRFVTVMAICNTVIPLVELLKPCDYRTLAIGDGGNDVRMMQQADIGVGISGKEGLQAARAADCSIGIQWCQNGKMSYWFSIFLLDSPVVSK
ncbi:hypothetical protein ACFE04_011830 [Oxalis oulophora]